MTHPVAEDIRGPARWWGLAGWLIASFLPGTMGVWFKPGAWYAALTKPAWNPPSWLFAPVWSTLYAAMGIAVWLVWSRGGWAAQRRPLTLFVVQLVLNAAWTPLFFGLHWPAVAFGEILLLWAAIATTLRAFWSVRRPAGALLLPYLAWVSFASALNFTLWRLNG